MEREIVRADPVLRRRALLVVLGLTLLGAAAILYLPDALRSLLALAARSPDEAGRRGVRLLLGFAAPVVVLGLAAGVDAIRRSLRALRVRQFPPPGARVIRDTPVLRGTPARVAGVLGVVLGVALLVLSALVPWLAYEVGTALRKGCPRRAAAALPPPAAPR